MQQLRNLRKEKIIEPKILDIAYRFVNLQICFSTKVALSSPYYKMMPPHLKNKLVDHVLI